MPEFKNIEVISEDGTRHYGDIEFSICCANCGKSLERSSSVHDNRGDFEVDVEFCNSCEKDIRDDVETELRQDFEKELEQKDEEIVELENKIIELEELIDAGVSVQKEDIQDVINVTKL